MKYWLEYVSGKLTMYHMLVATLTTLFVVSLVLAFVGELSYEPKALLLSAAVLIVVTFCSNIVFGKLYGVKTHNESSVITALLIFFILMPVSDIVGLAILGLAGFLASASKYLLAFRGRHIFNPAATGVVIVGLLGLTYSMWWVATPALLPITIAGAFLVLYKTRRLGLAGVFIAVSVPLIFVISLVNGQSLTSSLLSLISWPILFFAGFMLSEPLTLPPRRVQQLWLAAGVAVLFAIPLHFGRIGLTPEIALVLGNIVAFCLSVGRTIQLKFIASRSLTPTCKEFVFEPLHDTPHYVAGQYTELTLPHSSQDMRGIRRMFSMVSAPHEQTMRFGVKFAQNGSSFKQKMLQIQPGEIIAATGIWGDFTLPKDDTVPLLFIAGGIGITPFMSHLASMSPEQQKRVVLVYAAGSADELSYIEELRQTEAVLIAVIPEAADVPGTKTIQSKFVTLDIVKENVPNLAARIAYISGPPLMVQAVKKGLRASGVKKVKTDYFTGY